MPARRPVAAVKHSARRDNQTRRNPLSIAGNRRIQHPLMENTAILKVVEYGQE